MSETITDHVDANLSQVPLYLVNQELVTKEDKAVIYVYVFLQTVLTLAILLGNGVVLYAIVRHIRIRRTPTFMLITNLVAADLCMGFMLPLQAVSRLDVLPISTDYVCFIRLTTMTFASFATLFSVLLTAIDRYIAVCKFDLYATLASSKRVITAIVIMWIYSAVFAVYPVHYFTIESEITIKSGECVYRDSVSEVYPIFIPLQYFAILILMSLLYFKISRSAIRRKRLVSCDSFSCTRGVKIQRELRAAKFMAVILVVFVFCWTPFAVYQIYEAATENINPVIARLGNASVFLGIINSVVDPLIYPLRNKLFRRAIKSMLKI